MEHFSSKNKKAFTFIELMVVLAVTTFLFIIGIAGMMILQRSSRDNARINTGNEITKMINDFRKYKLQYPNPQYVTISGTKIAVSDGTFNKEYNLKGHLTASTDTNTTNSKTYYKYDLARSGFMFCIKLENGKTENFGTENCI